MLLKFFRPKFKLNFSIESGLRERQKLFENEACPLFSGDGCQGEGCAGDKVKRCKRGDDASCKEDEHRRQGNPN